MEAIYVIRRREHVRLNEPIYKIGMTAKQGVKRLYQYDNGLGIEVYAMRCVSDASEAERKLKEVFTEHFESARDVTSSTESYRGDINSMLIYFNQVVEQFSVYLNTNVARTVTQLQPLTNKLDLESEEEQVNTYDVPSLPETQDIIPEFLFHRSEVNERVDTITKAKSKLESMNELSAAITNVSNNTIIEPQNIDALLANVLGQVNDTKLYNYDLIVSEFLNPSFLCYNYDAYRCVLRYYFKTKSTNHTSAFLDKYTPSYLSKQLEVLSATEEDKQWFIETPDFWAYTVNQLNAKLYTFLMPSGRLKAEIVQACMELQIALGEINPMSLDVREYPKTTTDVNIKKLLGYYFKSTITWHIKRSVSTSEDYLEYIMLKEYTLDKLVNYRYYAEDMDVCFDDILILNEIFPWNDNLAKYSIIYNKPYPASEEFEFQGGMWFLSQLSQILTTKDEIEKFKVKLIGSRSLDTNKFLEIIQPYLIQHKTNEQHEIIKWIDTMLHKNPINEQQALALYNEGVEKYGIEFARAYNAKE